MTYPKTSSLERDLISRLRETASGNARAMAATVAVLGPASGSASSDALVDTLMGRRPARILHLRTRTGADEPFSAWSGARCSLDKQNRGICFEDLYLESSDDAAADPRVWGSFVLRELPALLLWLIPLGTCPSCMGDWEEHIDLVVIDGSSDPSSTGIGPAEFARSVRDAFSSAPAVTDLAWERLEPARSAVARLFDAAGTETGAAGLSSIRVGGADPWSRALLAAWLAIRLGWTPSASIGTSGSGDSGFWPGTVRNGSPLSFSFGGSGPLSIEFTFAGGAVRSVSFGNGRDAVLSMESGTTLEMPFPSLFDGDILARLIDAPLAEPQYADCLALLAGKQLQRDSILR